MGSRRGLLLPSNSSQKLGHMPGEQEIQVPVPFTHILLCALSSLPPDVAHCAGRRRRYGGDQESGTKAREGDLLIWMLPWKIELWLLVCLNISLPSKVNIHQKKWINRCSITSASIGSKSSSYFPSLWRAHLFFDFMYLVDVWLDRRAQ